MCYIHLSSCLQCICYIHLSSVYVIHTLIIISSVYVIHTLVICMCDTYTSHQCMCYIHLSSVYVIHTLVICVCDTYTSHQCMWYIHLSSVCVRHTPVISVCDTYTYHHIFSVCDTHTRYLHLWYIHLSSVYVIQTLTVIIEIRYVDFILCVRHGEQQCTRHLPVIKWAHSTILFCFLDIIYVTIEKSGWSCHPLWFILYNRCMRVLLCTGAHLEKYVIKKISGPWGHCPVPLSLIHPCLYIIWSQMFSWLYDSWSKMTYC